MAKFGYVPHVLDPSGSAPNPVANETSGYCSEILPPWYRVIDHVRSPDDSANIENSACTPIGVQRIFWRVRRWRLHGSAHASATNFGNPLSADISFDINFSAGNPYQDYPGLPWMERHLYRYPWCSFDDDESVILPGIYSQTLYGGIGASYAGAVTANFFHHLRWYRTVNRGGTWTPWRDYEFKMPMRIEVISPTLKDGDGVAPAGNPNLTVAGSGDWTNGAPGGSFGCDIAGSDSGTSLDIGTYSMTMSAALEPYRYWPYADDDGNNPTFDEVTGLR